MNVESIIIDNEERLRVAQLNSDVAELSNLLDDNLVFSALDGSIVGKRADLELHKSAEFRIIKMEVVERQIHGYENVVVVNVLMDASAEFNNVVQNDRIRYIRVWYKFFDGWRIISGSMRAE